MFVWSVKMNKKRLAGITAAGILVLMLVLGFVGRSLLPAQPTAAAAKPESDSSSQGEQAPLDMVGFLESFGWEVESTPCEKVNVTIPAQFNTVYEQYNAIQKQQGFDLTPYQGQTVQRYAYVVKNYPGQPDYIRANLLVCENEIIGGDICSIAQDGFIHGFAFPGQPPQGE